MFKWLRNRDLGFKNNIGDYDSIHNTIYSSVVASRSWCESSSNDSESSHGGVYNLEFSHDG